MVRPVSDISWGYQLGPEKITQWLKKAFFIGSSSKEEFGAVIRMNSERHKVRETRTSGFVWCARRALLRAKLPIEALAYLVLILEGPDAPETRGFQRYPAIQSNNSIRSLEDDRGFSDWVPTFNNWLWSSFCRNHAGLKVNVTTNHQTKNMENRSARRAYPAVITFEEFGSL